MAGINHTYTWSIASDSGSKSLSGSQSESGSAEVVIDQSFAAGSANVEYDVAFPHATLKGLFLLADKNCTVKFNDATSPILTISLVGGTPYVWDASTGYFANPLSADVTKLFVSCSASARLKGRALN